jgi:hypothetical protein
LRFHDLRHTTATLMLRAGVPVHHAQRVMRHRDVRLTTETYGHLVADDLRDAVERIAPVPPPPGGPLSTGFYRRTSPQKTKAATRRFPVRCRGLLSRGDRI